MWIYESDTGIISHDGEVAGQGYSGFGECKNDPDKECVKDHGPIPRGYYTMEASRDTQTHGPITIPLRPDPDNNMFNRGGFLIHGDSVASPGTASHGCIILPRPVRIKLANSPDRRLRVV